MKACDAARYLNAKLMQRGELVDRVIGSDVTARDLVSDFERHLHESGKAKKTIAERMYHLAHFAAAMKRRPLADIDIGDVAGFLDPLSPPTSNRHRGTLIRFFSYARSKGAIEWNPAEPTIPRREEVQRKRLTLTQYRAIFSCATFPIQNAMSLSLQTLQARAEIIGLHWSDVKDNELIVTRGKTAARSDAAWLAIGIGPELAAAIERCKEDHVLSPFMVHQSRRSNRARIGRGFTANSISRGFREARTRAAHEDSSLFPGMSVPELPTFHEIRALGAHLYREAGWPDEEIQRLLAHSNAAMTRHYLAGHGGEHARVKVRAGLRI